MPPRPAGFFLKDPLRKISEYEQHAAECRAMARSASPAHRAQLEQMAQTWDQLADARRRQLAKQGKSPEDDEPQAGSTA